MFTQNQIRQFLPVSAYQSSDMAGGSTNIGKVKVTATPYGEYNVQYVDSTGKVISFIIPEKSILWKKATAAIKMQYKSKATLVTVNPTYLVDTNNDSTADSLISGQDYMLNIRINSLYWDSDEVWGHKYGIVHATYGMSPSTFYKKLALSLAANFSREEKHLLKFYVTYATDADNPADGIIDEINFSSNCIEVTSSMTADALDTALTSTYADAVTGVIIDEANEADRPWRLGVQPMQDIEYIASPSTIIYSGEEVNWGKTEKFEGSVTINNGRKVADMEYFYHANRGDYNREAAWPNNWPSVEQINPANSYDIIDIHWSWEGNNHAVQRSEKDLTLAFDSTSHTEANKFLAAWNGISATDFVNSAGSATNAFNDSTAPILN